MVAFERTGDGTVSTLLELETRQAQRPAAVDAVNSATDAVDKANAAIRQAGVDFTRLNGQIPALEVKLTQDSEAAYQKYIAYPAYDAWELGAPLAAQKLALDFIRACAAHVAETLIPAANIEFRRADLALAESQSALLELEKDIVQAELVHLTAPAADSQGKVNVSSSALTEARNRAAVAAARVVQCRQALKDEIARAEDRKKQRAAKGLVSWANPS
jgi:hypothetical protein